MNTQLSPNYGACPCGGGLLERRLVEVNMTVDGQRIRIERVPQGACADCSTRVYKAEVLERIESIMKGVQTDDRLRRALHEWFAWP